MSRPADPAAPYEAIAELVQRELLLVTRGELDRLPELGRERARLMAALPPTPPAEARAALERALALQRRVAEELQRRRGEVLERMRTVRRGQRAAAGYRPATPRTHHISAAA